MNDTQGLRHHWDFEAAMDAVLENLVAPLPGDPWQGADQPTE